MDKDTREKEMELYQLDCILHEPGEETRVALHGRDIRRCRDAGRGQRPLMRPLPNFPRWPSSSFSPTRTGARTCRRR